MTSFLKQGNLNIMPVKNKDVPVNFQKSDIYVVNQYMIRFD